MAKKKYLLPSDRMSASEIKKMNGEIVMYEMKKPISWAKFKSYPVDIQKEYIQWFVDEFSMSRAMFAEMLGMSSTGVYSYLKKQDLLRVLRKHNTFEGKEKFYEWLKQFRTPAETETVQEPKPPVEKKERLVIPPFFNTITSGEILLEGKAAEIGQTLFNMFQNETITMQVKFEVLKNKKGPEDAEVV